MSTNERGDTGNELIRNEAELHMPDLQNRYFIGFARGLTMYIIELKYR